MIIRMGRPLANPQLRAIVSVGLDSRCFPPFNRLEQNKQRKIRIQIRDLHCLLGLVTKFDSFASFPPKIWRKKWDIRLDLNFRNGQDLTSVKKVWQAGDQIGGRYELLSQFFRIGQQHISIISWIMNDHHRAGILRAAVIPRLSRICFIKLNLAYLVLFKYLRIFDSPLLIANFPAVFF